MGNVQADKRSAGSSLYSGDSKSCPTEIPEVIASIDAEDRPIWKPIYRTNGLSQEKATVGQRPTHTSRAVL